MKHMDLKEYWKTTIINSESTFAVTLAFNPHCRGSHAAVVRVKAGSSGGANTVTIAYDASASRVRLPTRVDAFNRLTTARVITPDRVQFDVALLARNLDREILGPRYHRKPSDQWSSYIGFIEHPAGNAHVHLAWRFRDPCGIAGAELVKQWRALSPYYTAHVQPLNDPSGWADYMLKDQSKADLKDPLGLILSRPHSA